MPRRLRQEASTTRGPWAKQYRLRQVRGIAALSAAVMVTASIHVHAGGITDTAMPPGEQCKTAIAAAELAENIPPHLLAAIGRVESGRENPQTGKWAPWPWTIDVDGQGAFLPTKEAAIEAARTLQAQGILSIDVGCVQINLWYHRGTFPNLQQAFDPGLNATYGARFLKTLFRQTKDWAAAAGLYHSATAALAGDYRRKVMAVWTGAIIERATLDPTQALARAWAATLDDSPKSLTSEVSAMRSVSASVGLPALLRRAQQIAPRESGLSVSERLSSRN